MRVASRGSQLGQSLVEIALILPVLLTIISGTVDVGRLAYAYITIGNASYAGAQYASQSPEQSLDSTGIQVAVAAGTTTLYGATGSNPSVASTTGTDPYGHQFVSVSVTFVFAPVVPYPVLPSSISISRTVRMRVQT